MKDKLILVVATGIFHRQPIYRRAHELGCKLVFLADKKVDWVTPYAYDWIICPDMTLDASLTAIQTYLNGPTTSSSSSSTSSAPRRFDGIVTFDDYTVVLTGDITERLGYPSTTPKAIAAIKNKYALRKHCESVGIKVPKSLRLDAKKVEDGSMDDVLNALSLPLVLKPVSGAGSHFVRRITSIDELKGILREYTREAEEEAKHWATGAVTESFMVEEMVVGQEVDIDLLVDKGKVKFLSISDNYPSTGPGHLFMEIGGACPSRLSSERQRALAEMTTKLVESFGTQLHGCFHFEAFSTPNNDAIPIEMNLRLGGSEVLVFIISTFGVNLGIEALKQCIDHPLKQHDTSKPLRQCSSINFLSTGSGYIETIGYDPLLFNDPTYMGSMSRCMPGHPLKAPPLGFEFLGWMVAGVPYIANPSSSLSTPATSSVTSVEESKIAASTPSLSSSSSAPSSTPSSSSAETSDDALSRVTKHFKYTLQPFPRGDPHGYIPGTDKYYLDNDKP